MIRWSCASKYNPFLSTTERVFYSPPNFLRNIREEAHGQQKEVKRYLTDTLVPVCSGALPHARLARLGQSPILIEYAQPLFVWLSRDCPSVRMYIRTRRQMVRVG